MLTRNNDPRLLQFLALVLLVCAAASTVGIARFTIGNTITGALETNIANIITVAGFFSWYFVLMYVFAQPGRARVLPVVIPGLILGPVLYFAVLRPLHPLANQNLLLLGTFGCVLGLPALGRILWDRYLGGAAGDYRRKLDGILFTTLGLLLLTFTPVALLDIVTSLHPVTYDAHVYHFESTLGFQPSIVASADTNATPEPENLRLLRETATLRPILDVFGNDPAVLRDMQLLDPKGIDRLLTSFPVPAGYWVSTDNNLFLEYSTPKGNVLDGRRSYDDNLGFIERNSRPSK